MTWTAKLWKFNTTPDDVDMTAMQADITAQANGDTGSPKNKLSSMDSNSVDTSQIVASAIAQAELSSANGSSSAIAPSSPGALNSVIAGGEYAFYPKIYTSSSGAAVFAQMASSYLDDFFGEIGFNQTSYTTNVSAESDTGTCTIFYQNRYIQASPPYDMGDGLCHIFIFCLVDKSGNIVSTYSAPDAPWHYGGPTDIRRSRWKTPLKTSDYDYTYLADKAKFVKRLLAVGGTPTDQQMQDVSQWVSVIPTLERISVNEEVSQEIKQADMSLIPHPFTNVPDGHSVILLDPLSRLSYQLNEMQQSGEEDPSELLMNGFFKISNSALSRVGPPNVKTVSYRWK